MYNTRGGVHARHEYRCEKMEYARWGSESNLENVHQNEWKIHRAKRTVEVNLPGEITCVKIECTMWDTVEMEFRNLTSLKMEKDRQSEIYSYSLFTRRNEISENKIHVGAKYGWNTVSKSNLKKVHKKEEIQW